MGNTIAKILNGKQTNLGANALGQEGINPEIGEAGNRPSYLTNGQNPSIPGMPNRRRSNSESADQPTRRNSGPAEINITIQRALDALNINAPFSGAREA